MSGLLSFLSQASSNDIHLKVASSFNEFGFRLLAELAEREPGKNILVSGFSLGVALAMAANGARGKTLEAIQETLQSGEIDLPMLNSACAGLLKVQSSPDPQVILAAANALWIHQQIDLAPAYCERLKEYYAAEAHSLDLWAASAAGIINGWVAEKTHQQILELVTRDDLLDALVVLTNALYFKGQWANKFDPAQTHQRQFYSDGVTGKTMAMMVQSGDFDYLEERKFQAVHLPYGVGKLGMYIFLPARESSLSEFASGLSTQNWSKWLSQFLGRRGSLYLPRCAIEFQGEMKKPLSRLGMGPAFWAGADFSAMGAGPLFISAVLHKARLEINEEGSEAAAASAVIFARSVPPPPFHMVVDRPFFLAIVDRETGVILFHGLIYHPGSGK